MENEIVNSFGFVCMEVNNYFFYMGGFRRIRDGEGDCDSCVIVFEKSGIKWYVVEVVMWG